MMMVIMIIVRTMWAISLATRLTASFSHRSSLEGLHQQEPRRGHGAFKITLFLFSNWIPALVNCSAFLTGTSF